MISSLNLRTDHGTPGWQELDKSKKSPFITFRTKTNEKIQAHLGNVNLEDNPLPKSFSVNKRALFKPPWRFSPKTLYLSVDAIMVQSIKGEEYHCEIDLGQDIACCALAHNSIFYAYIIVEPAKDQRFKYWPVLIKNEK